MQNQTLLPGFRHILHGGDYNPDQWLDTPEILKEDLRLMDLAGCNAFSVGIFSWITYEAVEGVYDFGWLDRLMDSMAAAGKKILLATPSGSKPAWMAQKYPEIRMVDANGVRDPQETRHNHCWTSPVYRDKVARINAKLAERYAAHPALGGWHISNEYAGNKHGGDCYCELCQEAFRQFLKEKYGSLDGLNQAWYTSFWGIRLTDWSQVTPFVTSDTRELDWRRFVTRQCRSFIENETAPLRRFTPDKPVTINMMGFFYPLDYQELASVVDFVSDDVYPGWGDPANFGRDAALCAMRHDQQRAMKQKPFLVMESSPSATNWQEYARLLRPGTLKLQELMALAHGADGAMYFQWRKGRGNLEKTHGAVVDHVGTENTRVFRDVAELGRLYGACDDLAGADYPVQAAMIFDREAQWALDFSPGPGYVRNKDYQGTLQTHHQIFWEKNIPIDLISRKADFSRYRLLIVPMLFLTEAATAERLKAFVHAGGTLVATYLTGYVNENNAFHLGGLPGAGLMTLFGIWNEEIDNLVPTDPQSLTWEGRSYAVNSYAELIHAQTAQTLAAYDRDFYAGRPALTVQESGKGRAYYLAARTGKDFLADFYGKIASEAGVEPVLDPAWQKIHAARRVAADGGEFLFLFNYAESEEQTVQLPAGEFIDKANGERKSGRLTLAARESMILKRL